MRGKAQASNPVQVIDYDKETLTEHETRDINECIPYKETDSVTWINIDNVPPISFLEELRLGFDLHPVIEDDILALNHRPKLEVLDKYIFLRLRMLSLDADGKRIRSEQVSLVIADNFLITFQQGILGDTFEHIRDLIRQKESRVRSLGTDYLAYELVDSMVGGYFDVLEYCNSRMEQLENELKSEIRSRTLHSIYALKRELLAVRHAAWPLREIMYSLEHAQSSLIKEETKIYFRDLHTKLIQVVDGVDIYREMLSGLQDVYLSRVNGRTNEVMKLLTVITTVFMPLAFLTGFFGMNFTHLPGVSSPWGPLVALGVMASIAFGMIAVFIHKKWL